MKTQRTKTYLVASVVLAFFIFGYGVAWVTNDPLNAKGNPHRCKEDDERSDCKSIWERTSDDPVAFFTFWLVVFTAVLAGGTLLQMRFLVRADETAKRAADAAKASADLAIVGQRPWVSLECKISDPVIWNSTIIQIMAEFTVKNIGSTPALDVWIKTAIRYSGLAVEDPRVRLQQVAEAARAQDMAIGAPVLFPNVPLRRSVALHLLMDDIAKEFRRSGREFDQATDFPHITATIFAVVNYRVTFNDERHQTGMIYDLAESSGEIGSRRMFGESGRIEPHELTLRQDWAGFAD